MTDLTTPAGFLNACEVDRLSAHRRVAGGLPGLRTAAALAQAFTALGPEVRTSQRLIGVR